MALAGGIIAAVALPLALVAAVVVRRRKVTLFPARRPWRVPWGGFELTLAFIAIALIPELLQSAGVQRIAAGVIALPIQLSLLTLVRFALYPAWYPFRASAASSSIPHPSAVSRRSFGLILCRVIALGVLVWLVLTPLIHLLNSLVTITFTLLDLPVEPHPLIKLAGGSAREHVLFVAEACVAAPIIEELLFRGLLLPWIIGARERNSGGMVAQTLYPPSARPLVVMAVAALYSAGTGKLGPVVFAGVLTLGLGVLWLTARRGRRHARAIYTSAAFFGLVHSSVWPSPIPLFALGLGLGWLAVRTRGFIVPAIVHGLFNAVSAVYVLRGAA